LKVEGQVAVVTGSGGGIGSAVARSFAREGAKVVVADIQEDAAKRVAGDIRQSGGTALPLKLDVRSLDDIEKLTETVVHDLGKIDILVNCAGILSIRSFDKITEDVWDTMLDTNARGTFFCCQKVAQQMIRQGAGGEIVNISSIGGKIGAPLYTHYCASKFAVIGITKSLALELAKYGIRVNSVCPGDVDTDMLAYEFQTHAKLRSITTDAVRQEWTTRVPLGRLALPTDVANVVLFLVSDKSSYMTGQSLNVTGGTMTF